MQIHHKRVKRFIERVFNPASQRPVLGSKPYGGPSHSLYTFVVVTRQGFNINVPNANSTIRLGFCHGFAGIGIRYQLVSVFDIEQALPRLKRPIVFLSVYDYLDLSKSARKILRNYTVCVWVHADCKAMKEAYKPYGITPKRIPPIVYKRVLESEPNFIFAMAPPSSLEFYSDWHNLGVHLEAIPYACDISCYFTDFDNTKYNDIKMAFVGGYWDRKALQFNKYLKPYEDVLTVFGYNPWPYTGYKGLLPIGEERVLYQNACVCPAISEPHAETIGDMVERPFKIMGSGGLVVTDVIPSYRELFKEDELLIPRDLKEYHDMVHQALVDKDFNQRYREKGYKAIQERHTYAHRAEKILSILGLSLD